MEPLFTSRDINPTIRRIIERKVRNLVGTAGVTTDDQPDFIQDIIKHLLEHPFAFDGSKGSFIGIICCIVDRKIASILEYRRAAKRSHDYHHVSLDDEIRSGTGELRRLGDDYDVDTYWRLTGKASRTEEEAGDLSLDLQRYVRALPPDLRRIAQLLAFYDKSDVARRLGIPWSTFCDRCRKIWEHLHTGHLEEYL